MAGNPKRVSFGSHGSMVETLIIDFERDNISPEERLFYENNRYLHLSSYSKTSKADSNGSAKRLSHSSVNGGSDNPFKSDGELRHKADRILSCSRISRTDLNIVDPDVVVVVMEKTSSMPSMLRHRSTPPPPADEDITCLAICPSELTAPPPPPSDESPQNTASEIVHSRPCCSSTSTSGVVMMIQSRVETAEVPKVALQRAEEVRLSADYGCGFPSSSPSSSTCTHCCIS